MKQKKVRLVEDETSRRNPDSSSGIYLTAAKVKKCRLVADNRRENEEAKKETAKKTAPQKLYLQQKKYKSFQKCEDSMDSLSYYPTEELMFIKLVNLSSNTTKDVFAHIGGNLGELPNHRR